MRLNVANHVLNGFDLFRILIRDFHLVLFLERHHQFDDVERVRSQIFDEGRLRSDLIGANPELLADDLFDPSLNGCRHLSHTSCFRILHV